MTDSASRATEATGGAPVPAPVGDQPTVASGYPADPRPAAEVPRIGEYVVVEKIGEGGMGAVYLAQDDKLGRKVAIKTLRRELAANKSDRDRFEREARAAAAVEHDNIVPILHVGAATDGSPFIAMPFLQGEALDARLKRQPVAGLGLLLKVAREVADGLAAAHAAGLIHRDVKPGNIWLEGDLTSNEPAQQVRRCKLLDFGLARSAEAEDVQITTSGAILGTPAFMPPEQARGERVDRRADLFSLGVVLYRMATGKLPFNGPTAMAVLISLATETPPPARALNPTLPPPLADLIDRLMCKDPGGRPQSAAEVSAAVRQIVKDSQAKTSAPEVPAPPVRVATLPDAAEASSSQPRVIPVPAANVWEGATETADAPVPKKSRAAPTAPPKRNRLPWIAGLAVVLLALAAVTAVVLRVETPDGTLVVEIDDPEVEARIKGGKVVLVGPDGKERYTLAPGERNKKIDAGPYTIHVTGADGLVLHKREFTLKKGDTATVRVTLDPKAVAKKDETPKKDAPPKQIPAGFDPDRKAAEYVLSAGGTVAVKNRSGSVTAVGDLPPEPFQLATITLGQRFKFDEAGLTNCAGCEHLTALVLTNHPVTDVGLGYFKNCTKLQRLELTHTRMTDAGLGHFKGCKTLTSLALERTQVTDAGLVHIAGNAGLQTLILTGTGVGDVGLTHLRGLRQLARLDLDGARVTDAGLATLKAFAGLRHLSVRQLKVSRARVEELAKVLPQCKIVWDGGTIEPRIDLDADRRAAEYTLSIGGEVTVGLGAEQKAVTAEDDLPRLPFQLRSAKLDANPKVSDAGLAVFKGCRHLAHLYLAETATGDAGLAHLNDCTGLSTLDLNQTRVTGAGLAHLKDCRELTQLTLRGTAVTDAGLVHLNDCVHLNLFGLDETQVTDAGLAHLKGFAVGGLYLSKTAVGDAGLAHLKDCKGLGNLVLDGTRVTDAGLAHFKDCKGPAFLSLNDTQVTDAGLAALKGCPGLTHLYVRNTRVTRSGAGALANTLPKCRVEWGGGAFEPATAADRAAAEWVLSVGGTVRANGAGDGVKGAALPKGLFRLTDVLLTAPTKDADLAVFKNCAGLTDLYLVGTGITNAGLAHFGGCKNLTALNLSGTKVDDAGLDTVKQFRHLTDLSVGQTAVTAKGVKELAKVLPGCRIQWDGGTLPPTK